MCIRDRYCVNRCSNDVPRAAFSPRELAELTIGFYRRNYIEGLFLSSGVWKSPDYTCEQLLACLDVYKRQLTKQIELRYIGHPLLVWPFGGEILSLIHILGRGAAACLKKA